MVSNFQGQLLCQSLDMENGGGRGEGGGKGDGGNGGDIGKYIRPIHIG